MANEIRLIDANALLKAIESESDLNYGERLLDPIEFADMVEDAPTVDAVPVVHGRWEPVDHDGSWRVDRCSVCHRRMHYVDYDQPYQYCPNCGAKMDGDGNG